MNRRGFIAALGAAAAGLALDPERALWVPGAKTISIPSIDVMLPPVKVEGFAWLNAAGEKIGYRYLSMNPRLGMIFAESLPVPTIVGVDMAEKLQYFAIPRAGVHTLEPIKCWPVHPGDQRSVRESIASRLRVSPSRLVLA